MARPTPPKVTQAASDIGEQLAAWRKLLGLTAQQVAERAGVSRGTVSKVENGDVGVSFGAVLRVARSVGVMGAVVDATDPYLTDLGRARADETLPQRVRK